MGVTKHNGTMPDGYTPICNTCGVTLCWDIHQTEYEHQKAFWDEWRCKECKPDAIGSRKKWLNGDV